MGERVFQLPPVKRAEGLELEHTLKKMILLGVGLPDARPFPAISIRNITELAPAIVLVPGDKTELVLMVVQIKVKILTVRKEPIIAGQQNMTGQERGEFIEVEELGQPACKFGVVRVRDQTG